MMKKGLRSFKGFSLVLLLLFNATLSHAQRFDNATDIGTVAENLWYEQEAHWENTMSVVLGINTSGLHAFLDANREDFFKDRMDFMFRASNGSIIAENAADFFDSLKVKYVALYQKFLQTNTASYNSNPESGARYGNPTIQSTCNPSCTNINFQNGTLSAWDAYYGVNGSTSSSIIVNSLTGGTCGSVTQAGGPDPNTSNSYQVSLKTTPGTDPVAGGLIPFTPPLGGIAAMVGDGPNNGWGVGVLEQTYLVDPSNPILTIQYAVVLENPGHSGFQQPWFKIEVLDQNKNVIPGCGQYFVVAGSGNAGFKGVWYGPTGDTLYCRPWTTAFVPLNNYIGQCITVKFQASDCALGGHLGYAYIAATCDKISLVSSSNVFCNGQQSATILGPPGAATYQWTTTNGCIPGSSTKQQLGISCAGTYKLVTTSSAGTQCVDTFSITIPTSTAGPLAIPCFTSDRVCSGNATHFDASCSNPNGAGTKFYWDFYNNGIYLDSSGSNPSWTYSTGGLYQVKLHLVTSGGCSADTVITIAVDSTNAGASFPSTVVTPINTTSCSACNGGVNLTLSNFAAGVSYTVTNSFSNYTATVSNSGAGIGGTGSCNASSGAFSSNGKTTIALSFKNCLCPGTYYIFIKPNTPPPSSKCNPGAISVDTVQFIVSANGVNISTNVTTTSATCGNNNGSATVTALGGTSPYTYTWSSGLGNGTTKTGLPPGTYQVAITDSNNCIGSAKVTILSSGQLTALVTPYYISCYGANNGSIKITPTGGGSPFVYNWSPNVSVTDSAGGLAAGTYSITITDAGGCSGTYSSTILQPSQIRDSLTSALTSVGCGGVGSATFGVKGGFAPYSFKWSDGKTSPTNNTLAVRTTKVTITDANGCTKMDSVTVTGSGSFSINAGPDVTLCTNDSTRLNVTGIPAGSAIAWSPSSGLSCNNCADPVAKPATTTTYFVTVTDNGGCSSTDTLIVQVASSIAATSTPSDTVVCYGSFVQLNASGGNTYVWYPLTGLSNPNIANPLLIALAQSTYTVSVSSGSCSATATVTVNIFPALPIPTISQSGDTLICSTSPQYTSYQWYFNSTPIPGATSTKYVSDQSGNYNVAVSDSSGCLTSVGINIVLGINHLLSNEGAVFLYPNPAHNMLTVYSSLLRNGEAANLLIMNVLGETILSKSLSIGESGEEASVNVGKLPSGIYFVQLQTPYERTVKRFVKE